MEVIDNEMIEKHSIISFGRPKLYKFIMSFDKYIMDELLKSSLLNDFLFSMGEENIETTIMDGVEKFEYSAQPGKLVVQVGQSTIAEGKHLMSFDIYKVAQEKQDDDVVNQILMHIQGEKITGLEARLLRHRYIYKDQKLVSTTTEAVNPISIDNDDDIKFYKSDIERRFENFKPAMINQMLKDEKYTEEELGLLSMDSFLDNYILSNVPFISKVSMIKNITKDDVSKRVDIICLSTNQLLSEEMWQQYLVAFRDLLNDFYTRKNLPYRSSLVDNPYEASKAIK